MQQTSFGSWWASLVPTKMQQLVTLKLLHFFPQKLFCFCCRLYIVQHFVVLFSFWGQRFLGFLASTCFENSAVRNFVRFGSWDFSEELSKVTSELKQQSSSLGINPCHSNFICDYQLQYLWHRPLRHLVSSIAVPKWRFEAKSKSTRRKKNKVASLNFFRHFLEQAAAFKSGKRRRHSPHFFYSQEINSFPGAAAKDRSNVSHFSL